MLFFAAFLLTALPAGAQIARPQLGYVVDTSGVLRPVFGVAAAATLGDAALENTISFACSAHICMAKTDAALISFAPGVSGSGPSSRQSVAAPPGPTILAIGGGGAWIYFQASQQVARWHDGVLDAPLGDFAPGDFASGAEILSLRATADGFDYAITRDRSGSHAGNIWIEHYSASDGSIVTIDSLTPASAVMLVDGGVLMSLPDQLVLRRSDGQQLTFPLVGAKTFHAAGKGYVEIVAPSGLWVLRTDAGHEQLSMLPGDSQGTTPGAITRAAPGVRQ
jgi:hypothetical protein